MQRSCCGVSDGLNCIVVCCVLILRQTVNWIVPLRLQASTLYLKQSCCRLLNSYGGSIAVLSLRTFERGGLAVAQEVILSSPLI